MLNAALSIIHDEHRSLAAVAFGLRHVTREYRNTPGAADFHLLRMMICYLDEFPEKLHHPKEDAYLFARLSRRTTEADRLIADLERQHIDGASLTRELESALDDFEAGKSGGLERFAAVAEALADRTLEHIEIEERSLIPLAISFLTAEDWVEIGAAFGENGDPRFGVAADDRCRELFSRIASLAPPPIGTGPAKN